MSTSKRLLCRFYFFVGKISDFANLLTSGKHNNGPMANSGKIIKKFFDIT